MVKEEILSLIKFLGSLFLGVKILRVDGLLLLTFLDSFSVWKDGCLSHMISGSNSGFAFTKTPLIP